MATPSPRRRVLFVEDQVELRAAYARFFRDRYEMAFAETGAEALAEFRRFAPDVLVLDMQLPDTDGIDVLRQVRQQRPEVPVVITTAYMSMEPLVSVLGIGYSGYLLKPFELDDLAACIDAAG